MKCVLTGPGPGTPKSNDYGTNITYAGGRRDILVLDPRTGVLDHPKGLTFAAKGYWQYYNVHSIRWSPDGKQIAGAFEVRWRSGIFVINLDPSSCMSRWLWNR